MNTLSKIAAVIAFGALLATGTAGPAPAPAANAFPANKEVLTAREDLADLADVNVYTGTTCDGTATTYTTTGGSQCYDVSGANSILVSEHDCDTHTWSGANCEGSSRHISGGACVTVAFGSVKVDC